MNRKISSLCAGIEIALTLFGPIESEGKNLGFSDSPVSCPGYNTNYSGSSVDVVISGIGLNAC